MTRYIQKPPDSPAGKSCKKGAELHAQLFKQNYWLLSLVYVFVFLCTSIYWAASLMDTWPHRCAKQCQSLCNNSSITWCHSKSSVITRFLAGWWQSEEDIVILSLSWVMQFQVFSILLSCQSLDWKHQTMKSGSSILGRAGWWRKFNNQGLSPRDQTKAWKSFTHTTCQVKISH